MSDYNVGPAPDPTQRQPLPAIYQARNQYLTDVLTRLRYMMLWVDDPDQALEVDPFVYEKIEREVTIEKARNYRRHMVAGARKAVHIEADPADPRSALLVSAMEFLTSRIERFDTVRNNLADAFFKGMTVGLIEGDWAEALMPGDSERRQWWFPTAIRDVDKRRVRIEYDADKRERWTIFSFERNQWETIKAEDSWHYLWHRYDTTERSLNYGIGLCQRLVYYWTIKTIAFETFTRGAERWGYGWIVGKIKNLVGGSTANNLKTYTKLANDLVAALEKQREKHIFVADMDNVDLQVFGPQGTGHEMLRDILDYCDQQITGLILAATLPTGSGGKDAVGSLARADVEADSTQTLLSYDRSILAETLRGVLFAVHRCNEGNFAALGLEDVGTPRYSIREEQAPDYKANAEVVSILLGAGVPLRRSEVYERTGFSAPDPGDDADLLMAPAAPAAPLDAAAPPPELPVAPAAFRAEADSLRAEVIELRRDVRALLVRPPMPANGSRLPPLHLHAPSAPAQEPPRVETHVHPTFNLPAPSIAVQAAPAAAPPKIEVYPPMVNASAPQVSMAAAASASNIRCSGEPAETDS